MNEVQISLQAQKNGTATKNITQDKQDHKYKVTDIQVEPKSKHGESYQNDQHKPDQVVYMTFEYEITYCTRKGRLHSS